MSSDTKQIQNAILFSRLLRWAIGILFIGTGIYYYKEGAWPAIVFGLVAFVTGFFRPRRCLEEGCNITQHEESQ